ncbi:alpha-ketoglutarate-dependent dioxygenase alkB homolog 3-like isoform X2 [Gordionus sp. m RMFG-2023]|uniref:alpha-ketoglutarate-dependent dioxygenase alkB homolog 3-like isoform X2 n=1 Tax=Gordionus sp. m RMFG-2023 TaxID=3053472 RepID=UPI0031FBD529
MFPLIQLFINHQINESGDYTISTSLYGLSKIHINQTLYSLGEADNLYRTLINSLNWENRYDISKLTGEKIYKSRLITWFGDVSYTYSNTHHVPNNNWHPLLIKIKADVERYCNTNYKFSEDNQQADLISFNSCLCNLYRNEKDGVDWHSDDEIELGKFPFIASLSLGEIRNFLLRRIPDSGNIEDYEYTQQIKVPLNHGSLFIMQGATQKDWQHKIPKEYHDKGARINLTFRRTYDINALKLQ